jgi:hypothetical protein
MAFRNHRKFVSAVCFAALGVAIMVGSATRADAAQLIVNGDFLGGTTTVGASVVPDSWTPNSGYTSQGYNQVVTGGGAISGNQVAIGNLDSEPVPMLSQTFADASGSLYVWSIYVRYAGNGGGDPDAFFDILINGTIVEALDSTASASYANFESEFIGTGSDTFAFQGNTNPSEWYVSNVTVTGDSPVSATPLPSTWTMLFAGFVGLGFFGYSGSKKNAAALLAAA